MRDLVPRYSLLLLCVFVTIGASGCWMQGSNEVLPTAVARNLPTDPPTATITPEPSLTPSPTPTSEATEEGDEFGAQLANDALTQEPDAGITEVAQLDNPDEDFGQDDPVLQQDPAVQPDDPFGSATAILATETQRAIDETATEIQRFNLTNVPITATPSPDPFAGSLTTETPTPDAQAGGGVVVSGADCVHEVTLGQNLYRLGITYGVPARDIATRNGIANVNLIYERQQLIIPGCGTTGAVPPPTSVASLTTRDGSGTVGGTTGGTTGGVVGGSAGGVQHLVEQGETLYEISVRYNVPIRTIAAANGISNVNLIYFNQTLTIP